MTTLRQDIAHAFRLIRRYPSYSLLSIATLALGIGLVAGQFSFTNGVLYKGLPFEDSEEIVNVERRHVGEGEAIESVPIHDFEEWVAQQESFEGLSAYYLGTVNLRNGKHPLRLSGGYISTNFAELLRVQPVIGRAFTEEDGLPGAPATALIGYRVWEEYFEGREDVVGSVITLNGGQSTVIGVMPEGFRFPENQDVWVPLPYHAAEFERSETRYIDVFGRLSDGVSMKDASAAMSVIAARLADAWPDTHEGMRRVEVEPFIRSFIGGEAVTIFNLMLFMVFLVLVVACANVANLTLARAMQRRRELAIRSSLGANRRRLIRQMVTETTVLAMFGAVGGILLAHFGMRAITRYVQIANPPFWMNFDLDARVLVFTCGVTVLAGVLSGIIPAIRASQIDLNSLMKDSGRGSSLFMGRFARVLTVLQIGVSCALLFAAFLSVKDTLKLSTRDLPFDPEAFLTGRVGLFEEDYPDAAARAQFYERIEQRLREHPEIADAALNSRYRFASGSGARIEIDGMAYNEGERRPFARYASVTPGYFELICGGVRQGRGFLPTDTAESEPVVIINESLANVHWSEENPLGRRIRFESGEERRWFTVVGVVPDLALDGNSDSEEDRGQGFYRPFAQDAPRFATLVVLPRGGDPRRLGPVLQDLVVSLDPDLPVYSTETIAESLEEHMRILKLFSGLFALFGATAVFLAGVGIYGIMAFSVRQRSQEIGIRMALGATPSRIHMMVMRSGVVQVVMGLGLGLLLGFLLSQPLSLLLEETKPDDWRVIAGVIATILLVVVASMTVPARRAAAVVPMRVLRAE